MNGEIITEGEMREAMGHAEKLMMLLADHEDAEGTLRPAANFLLALAYKGQGR